MRFKEWKEVRLDEIGTIITGKTPSTKVEENFGKKYPFITPRDMNDMKYIKTTERYLSQRGLDSVAKQILEGDSICVSCIGSDMGKVMLNKGISVTNQQINSITKIKKEYDVDFIYYSLKPLKEYLHKIAGGSTMPIVNKSKFSGITITVPPLKKQKSIAHILSTLDEKIEINNQINKKLEEIAQTIFKHWFVDFEFPNEDGEPYKSSGGEMVESELGMIPKGWEVRELGEIAMMKNGVNYSREQEGTEVKVVNVRDFDGSVIVNTSNLDSILLPERQIKDYLLYEYDTVVVRSARPGETLLVTNNSQVVYSGFTIRVQTNEDILKLYVFYCIRNAMEILNNSSNGTIFKNLNQKILGALKIVVPNKDVIEVYNSIVIPILNQISEGVEENEKLTQLRDTLLPKLMSGEIRVPLESEDDIS